MTFYYAIRKILDIIKILLNKYGYRRSISEGKPCNADGKSIPWYTYPAIEYINNIILKDKDVFEWGSGSSTIFWSSRAKSVTSVEHSPEWYKKTHKLRRNNINIFLKQDKVDYVGFLKTTNRKYDIIVVDGEYRFECCKLDLRKYLKNNGVVILDNSDWFSRSRELLKKKGLLEVDFSGFGPLNNYTWTTSIFFSSVKGIKFKNNISPIGAIKHSE